MKDIIPNSNLQRAIVKSCAKQFADRNILDLPKKEIIDLMHIELTKYNGCAEFTGSKYTKNEYVHLLVEFDTPEDETAFILRWS